MKTTRLLAILVAALAIGITSASATPLPKMEGSAPASEMTQNVEKVHGWHRYCAWGPSRYHRHVPGVGRVGCGGPRVYVGPRVHHFYGGPRHYWRHGYVHRRHGRGHGHRW